MCRPILPQETTAALQLSRPGSSAQPVRLSSDAEAGDRSSLDLDRSLPATSISATGHAGSSMLGRLSSAEVQAAEPGAAAASVSGSAAAASAAAMSVDGEESQTSSGSGSVTGSSTGAQQGMKGLQHSEAVGSGASTAGLGASIQLLLGHASCGCQFLKLHQSIRTSDAGSHCGSLTRSTGSSGPGGSPRTPEGAGAPGDVPTPETDFHNFSFRSAAAAAVAAAAAAVGAPAPRFVGAGSRPCFDTHRCLHVLWCGCPGFPREVRGPCYTYECQNAVPLLGTAVPELQPFQRKDSNVCCSVLTDVCALGVLKGTLARWCSRTWRRHMQRTCAPRPPAWTSRCVPRRQLMPTCR